MRHALFIGRWQPFHNGHDYIIRQALDAGKAVLIAVRDTPISESDPYTVEERIEMIRTLYSGRRVQVMGIPDIESVNIGRGVGYAVNRFGASSDIEGISATAIRRAIRWEDGSWKDHVPPAIAEWIEAHDSCHAGQADQAVQA